MQESPYSREFFENRNKKIDAAETILNIVLPILKPRSLLDLGTAVGTWPHTAKRLGVKTVLGIDGPWVPQDQRLIDSNEFITVDLEGNLPDLGIRYDMAVCTEVLEHISGPASDRAIAWLCRQAPAVLFSAAIPMQGGVNHINEAWQSHWAQLFAAQGFKAYDILRPKIWRDHRIPYWYRQNIILMADEALGRSLDLSPTDPRFLDLVHPELYTSKSKRLIRRDAGTFRGRFNAFKSLLGSTKI